MLTDACYEMDDVVDEWSTAMVKLAIQKREKEYADNAPSGQKKKLCRFIPSPSCCLRQVNKLIMRHDIAHRIVELNEQLDEIIRERDRYGFQLNGGSTFDEERLMSTFLVDESTFFGRDSHRKFLLCSLLGEGSSSHAVERNFCVISLVGMGGIGKTALAQIAYNHPSVKRYFEKVIWVCVSQPFDRCKVAITIIESIEKSRPNVTEFSNLMAKVCELIGKSGKIFIILDDVWNEDFNLWDPFRIALKNCAPGSRILVTTQNSGVAEIMESETTINLGVLSEEDCWSIFSKIAFFDQDSKECAQLEDLARQISSKCKGLPPAAKTLGSLMRFKKGRDQWMSVLKSNLWELEDSKIEKDLFGSLLLSYYDLPSSIRRCFSFCAVFPKGYLHSEDQLLSLWMAHRFVEPKSNVEIESSAREYLETLIIRSFLQKFNGSKEFIMHDIVHDFAQSIAKKECVTKDSGSWLESDYTNAWHLLLDSKIEAELHVSIDSAKGLRSLFQTGHSADLFQNFRRLRALTLMDSKELPDTVDHLIHLRYLNLDNYSGELPETIGNMCNLQFLKIVWSMMVDYIELPPGMVKLISLRHLSLLGVWLVFPRGIGSLVSLSRLERFCINDKDTRGCNLGELQLLNNLQGSLEIHGLGNVVDVSEAENAQLKKKTHLHDLTLSFGKGIDREGMDREIEPSGYEELVLNALEPHSDLGSLHIGEYKGLTLSPNWLISMTKLKRLRLYLAKKLMSLPPLGKLPFLEILIIEDLCSLKKVGVEFFGIEEPDKKKDNIIVFPNLTHLEFTRMAEWEEWIATERMSFGGEEELCIKITPRLENLYIQGCPKLKLQPDFLSGNGDKLRQFDHLSILPSSAVWP